MKKVLLLLTVLVIPGAAYLVLQTGKNNYQTLEIFGPKEPVVSTSGGTPDTVYHTIGDFSFISQDSSLITQETVKGKIYIADFFFTTCKSICPKMSNNLMRVQNEFSDDADVLLISHTVDPENDTPPVLAEYAEKHHVIKGKWFFVTGDKKQLYDVARNSYYITAMDGDGSADDFIHSEKIVLVDKERRIRGFYDGTDYMEVTRLIEEVKVLKWGYSNKK
ncbi:MAG: SCO family protein [Bacteroidota bacterium]